MSAVLRIRQASYRYPAGAAAINDVSLTVSAGDYLTVIGPNGCGKSTLLKLLLGLLRPDRGSVLFRERPAAEWPRRDFARQVGVVAQLEELAFPITVRELVAMGRYPHLGAWRREAADDRAAIEQAMEQCDVARLARRPVQNLSGGERQRARVARALAQQPAVLILDEPTSALDLSHEMTVFELLDQLRAARGLTVVTATHNINLAARFSARLLLLRGGSVVAHGTPREVLSAETISAVYSWPVRVFTHPGPGPDSGRPQIVPLSSHSTDD